MDLALTDAGKRKVAGLGDRSEGGRMLGLIDDHGSLTIRELSSLMRIPPRRAKSIANGLHKRGLIRADSE